MNLRSFGFLAIGAMSLLSGVSCHSVLSRATPEETIADHTPPHSDVKFWNEVTKRSTEVSKNVPPEIADRLKEELSNCHILSVQREVAWSVNGLDFVDVAFSYATPPGSGGFEGVIYLNRLFLKETTVANWSKARQFLIPADVNVYEKPALTLDFLEKAADEELPSGEIRPPKGERPKFR